jgi:glutamate/tyrosine decarboxylase-like PLP-dependent enzyme
MKRDLVHVAHGRQQNREDPRIHRAMRMPAHVHHVARKHIARIQGMQRIDLGVFGAVEVIDVVALDWLVKKENA